MNVEKMESVNNHQIRFNLNEMSVVQRDELERPLLAQQQESGQVDNDEDEQTILDIDQRQSSVYRKNALSGLSALSVQGFAITFLALIWGLVLASMPLNPLPLFGYHPMIQSLAFLLLLQSILTLQPTTKSRPNEKQKAFSVHRLFNLALVLPLFTIGASIMWYLHHQPNAKHFISWHGILGTTVIVWTWLQVAIGIAVTSFDGRLFGGLHRAKKLWKFHRLSGYFILPSFALVLYLGAAQTSWSQMNANKLHHFAIIISLLGIIAALFVRIQSSKLPSLSRN